MSVPSIDGNYTLRLPYMPPELGTPWHATDTEGPFARRTVGYFRSYAKALEWARAHLHGCPYEVCSVDEDGNITTATR